MNEEQSDIAPQKYSLMSRPDIIEAIEKGEIMYREGSLQHIKNTSVDLTLGSWYWEETTLGIESRIFNPNSRDDVNRVWGRLCFAPRQSWWLKHGALSHTLKGFDPSDRMFFIPPGHQVLSATREFIGGMSRDITTMMKARSGAGRSFLEVCRCAGWGDIGYHTRWTMEINNTSSTHFVPMRVGHRYAQLIFFRGRRLRTEDQDYRQDGKYQESKTEDVKSFWTPESLRPALYNDYEIPAEADQKIFYRCTNAACGFEGKASLGNLPSVCNCGAAVYVYGHPQVDEKVWPVYEVCVECGYIHEKWLPKTLKEACELRRREKLWSGPQPCKRCGNGFRHMLGGEYETWLPDTPAQ